MKAGRGVLVAALFVVAVGCGSANQTTAPEATGEEVALVAEWGVWLRSMGDVLSEAGGASADMAEVCEDALRLVERAPSTDFEDDQMAEHSSELIRFQLAAFRACVSGDSEKTNSNLERGGKALARFDERMRERTRELEAAK